MCDSEITNFELRKLLRHYQRNNLDAKLAAKAIRDALTNCFEHIVKLANRDQKIVDNRGLYFEK